MKILIGHNRYQVRAGEDAVFEAEVELLRAHGHEVVVFEDDNRRIAEIGRVKLVVDTVWSRESYRRLREVIEETRPAIAHFHNLIPLFSNAVLEACRDAGVPVVQTLHNYRALCPAATFYREGRTCERCAPKRFQWPAIRYGCYRRSRGASAALACKHLVDKWRHTWAHGAEAYIAMTDFMRQKYIQYGFPSERIFVKPNFIAEDRGIGAGKKNQVLFAGRLAREKGVHVLLEAWRMTNASARLVIAGDGPLRDRVERAAQDQEDIIYGGAVPFDALIAIMKDSKLLIFPSLWYEGFPRTVVEAFSVGLPVLASRIGGLESIVQPGQNGVLVEPGVPAELARALEGYLGSPEMQARLRAGARRSYEQAYRPETNYAQLIAIYEWALQQHAAR